MTIVRLGADVVSSSPAARQFFFIYIYIYIYIYCLAFPKSLHCTDEAQQAETDLSAVLSICIVLYIFFKEVFQ